MSDSALQKLLQNRELLLLVLQQHGLLRESLLLLSDLLSLLADLRLLLPNLFLLLLEGVDKDGRKAVVFDAFDLAFLVTDDQQRLDRRDVFRAEA